MLVRDVLDRQQNTTEQLTGPAWKVAFKDGQPSPAAQAFAKKAGVALDALDQAHDAEGRIYIGNGVQKRTQRGRDYRGEPAGELGKIYWAKSMYWRAGKPERFVRPVRWMVALLDSAIVPVEFGRKRAGNVTYGHRVLHGDAAVTIAEPAGYTAKLESAFVMADVGVRRERIRRALDRATRTIAGARWREDEPLVETVTHLTEWPTVVLGAFEREYLDLPEEVLVTVMRDHQKYFAVDEASGKLGALFSRGVEYAGGCRRRSCHPAWQ